MHPLLHETESAAALREENRRLRALVSFGRQVTAERDLRAQLRLLCLAAQRTTGATAAAVLLRDPSRGSVDAVETVGFSADYEHDWREAARGERGTELGHILHTRLPTAFPDVDSDDRAARLVAGSEDAAPGTAEP